MAVLQVNNLRKGFGDLEVLKGVSFSLEQGQVLAIIGSSGSGKTTLLRCLNFLERQDEGTVTVNGRPGTQQDFGLVFQNFNLFPQYTVLKNVTLAPSLRQKGSRETVEQTAVRLLTQVGLADKLEAYPWQLSGGQQQRVAIARALALQPEILCFDEPTSALDPELTAEVLRVIRNLKGENRTMIVVTHEMEFAKSVADVVIYMAEGVIEEIGTPEQIFESPKSRKTRSFLGLMKEQY